MRAPLPQDPSLPAFQAALAGQYAIERELGRGGFGVVYLARELSLDRPVALKVLAGAASLDDARGRRERLVREARTSAKLAHPNIVPIHRVDEAGGFVYFAMGFVEGETLAARLRREGRLAPAEAARILRDAAWALGYAHARGVVHCDVKPDNVFLDRDTGRTLVMDFGIAQLTREGEAAADGIAGTVAYMSPEQIRAEALDGRSDLYALGVMAYQLLTGRLPFEGTTVADVLVKHLDDPAPKLATVCPGLPPSLAQAVDRCLAKSREERFESSEQFAEAIEAVLAKSAELPPALRVWYASGVQLTPVAVLMLWFSAGAVFFQASGDPAGARQSLAAVAMLGAPLLLLRLRDLRRLAAAGYRRDDVVRALRRRVTERAEELALPGRGRIAVVGRLVRSVTFALATATVLLSLAALAGPPVSDGLARLCRSLPPFQFDTNPVESTITAYYLMSSLGALAAFFYPADRATRPLAIEPLRARLWTTPLLERLWAIATAGRRSADSADVTARASAVLPLHDAIVRMHRELPRRLRAQLPELPRVVRRLGGSLQRLDARLAAIEQLEAAMLPVLAGQATVPLRAVAEDPLATVRRQAASLADERARVAERRVVARQALELVRLDLLRLRVGAATSADLTAAVDAAQRLGAEIDLLLSADHDVTTRLATATDSDATLSLSAS